MKLETAAFKSSVRKWLQAHPDKDPHFILEPGIYRLLTSPFRRLPDFLVIGGQKCGTTSLYNYLGRHPEVTRSSKKEPLYFDTMYSLGSLWYRAFFPSRFDKPDCLVGDGSVHSILHPHAPARAFGLVPQAKIIILLRNPVDRAYSHYQMSKRNRMETLSFEDAVHGEDERLGVELRKINENGRYFSPAFVYHSYLLRGVYVDQIMRWMDVFPREQFMIVDNEDLSSETLKTMNGVYEFLELRPRGELKTKKSNVRNYPDMDPSIRHYLIDYFRPHNERLNQYLGTSFDWDQ